MHDEDENVVREDLDLDHDLDLDADIETLETIEGYEEEDPEDHFH